MSTLAIDNKQVIEEYFAALSGKAKTEELIDRFVDDPELKQHILMAELAFPEYELIAEEVIAEGDTTAVRAEFRGTHKGEFAGVAATGREVSAALMLFYRMSGGRIAKFWMVLDTAGLMQQLTA